MEEGKGLFRAGLTTSIDALAIAQIALQESAPGEPNPHIVASLRRIARSILNSDQAGEDPAVRQAAHAVEEAAAPDLLARVTALIERLQRASEEAPEERANALIISSDAATVGRLEEILGAPNRAFWVAPSAAEAERRLDTEPISLILLDLFLPDTDGRNLLVKIRERPTTAATPVLVVNSVPGSQPMTECFALGADAYFDSPIDEEMLAGAVSRHLQRAAERSIEVRLDPLTKLPNRAAFREAYVRAASLSVRQSEPLSIAIIDLDHFKSVNDNHGHAAGDRVLQRFAQIVSNWLRRSDVLARWGGEEFVALFPNTEEKGAVQALEKALQVFEAEAFEGADGSPFHVTFSAGVARVAAQSTVEQAVGEADRYLYLAKAAGRQRVLSPESSIVPPNERILLAEHDEFVRSVVQQRLEQESFEVLLHDWNGPGPNDGMPLNLVLIDVETDPETGFALLTGLRQREEFRSTPMVVLTGFGNAEHIVRGFELGADDYILKPFSSTELVARVLRLLKKR